MHRKLVESGANTVQEKVTFPAGSSELSAGDAKRMVIPGVVTFSVMLWAGSEGVGSGWAGSGWVSFRVWFSGGVGSGWVWFSGGVGSGRMGSGWVSFRVALSRTAPARAVMEDWPVSVDRAVRAIKAARKRSITVRKEESVIFLILCIPVGRAYNLSKELNILRHHLQV